MNIQIYLGNYPCIIPADGATTNFLMCQTTDTLQNNDIINLPLSVLSNNVQASINPEMC